MFEIVFYSTILELWSAENKNRSKKTYVVHTGEGGGQQRPEGLVQMAVVLCPRHSSGSCTPISGSSQCPQETTEMFFLPSTPSGRRWHVPLGCILLPCLPLVSFCLEHSLYPCELKPQMVLMEKLPSLDLRTAVG